MECVLLIVSSTISASSPIQNLFLPRLRRKTMNIPIKVLVILLLCHVHLNIAEMMTAYKSTSLLTETNPESGRLHLV